MTASPRLLGARPAAPLNSLSGAGGTAPAPDRPTTRARLGAWAELLRVSALFTVPGDALAGAAAAGRHPGRGTALAVGASLCLYEAGMALNDWADREEDAVDRPHRPIPSGRVTPGAALAAAGALTAAGLALAGRAGRPALAVASGLAATVWAYDLHLKHTKLGPAAMATARTLDLLLGATADAGSVAGTTAVPPRTPRPGAAPPPVPAMGSATGSGPAQGTSPAGAPSARPATAAGLTTGPAPAAVPASRSALAAVPGIRPATSTTRTAAPGLAPAPRPGTATATTPGPAKGTWPARAPSGRPATAGAPGTGWATAAAQGPRPATAAVTRARPVGAGPAAPLAALPAALLLGAHTYAVTSVSRHEVHGGSTVVPLAALAGVAGLGAVVVRGRLTPGEPTGPPATAERLLLPAFVGAYLRTSAVPLLHAALNPSPPLTQRAVGGGIRAMIPLQAALAARAGAPIGGLAVMGLVPLARALARKVSPT
uniref:UbiA family prenyltransferase n=1 Tax=Streptomyces sp. NBC_01401 TaxID=2903854 RepID=A0AAU3GPR3_9ACTN